MSCTCNVHVRVHVRIHHIHVLVHIHMHICIYVYIYIYISIILDHDISLDGCIRKRCAHNNAMYTVYTKLYSYYTWFCEQTRIGHASYHTGSTIILHYSTSCPKTERHQETTKNHTEVSGMTPLWKHLIWIIWSCWRFSFLNPLHHGSK